jgi:hypothetical protein
MKYNKQQLRDLFYLVTIWSAVAMELVMTSGYSKIPVWSSGHQVEEILTWFRF